MKVNSVVRAKTPVQRAAELPDRHLADKFWNYADTPDANGELPTQDQLHSFLDQLTAPPKTPVMSRSLLAIAESMTGIRSQEPAPTRC